MEIKDYLKANRLRLPQKILVHYQRKGLISDPLTVTDKAFLENLNKVWHDRATIGCMMSRLTKKERDWLPETWMLSRAERWALTRFYNTDDGRKYPPRISTVRKELVDHGLELLSVERLRELQTIARNRRKLERKKAAETPAFSATEDFA